MFFTAVVISSLLAIDASSHSAGKTMKLDVSSSAFSEGQFIPEKHTCDGGNVSPPIQWSGPPANAKSIAIICEDPDAPS